MGSLTAVLLWKPWTDGQRLSCVEEPGRDLFDLTDHFYFLVLYLLLIKRCVTYCAFFVCLFVFVGWVVFPWE